MTSNAFIFYLKFSVFCFSKYYQCTSTPVAFWYNFDPVNDKPLPGRYEWVKLDDAKKS
ncbi:putative cyclin-dependent kinase inhibitor domain-containing protein [Helianthus debilis subsp. tardiflorus]